MSDPKVHRRLLELLWISIRHVEGFLSSNKRYPPGVDELYMAAEYLEGVGLSPDGKWLIREYQSISNRGYAQLSSDVYAANPQNAHVWGYPPQFSQETNDDRRSRSRIMNFQMLRLLERLRGLLRLVSQAEQGEHATVNTNPTVPQKREAHQEHHSEAEVPDASRESLIQTMSRSVRVAYYAFAYAESKAGRKLQDREAYELLRDEGIPEHAGNRRELTEYKLPAFDTWSRQLREAREALGEQKYSRRRGRSHGKSIVKLEEIAHPQPDAYQ